MRSLVDLSSTVARFHLGETLNPLRLVVIGKIERDGIVAGASDRNVDHIIGRGWESSERAIGNDVADLHLVEEYLISCQNTELEYTRGDLGIGDSLTARRCKYGHYEMVYVLTRWWPTVHGRFGLSCRKALDDFRWKQADVNGDAARGLVEIVAACARSIRAIEGSKKPHRGQKDSDPRSPRQK